MSDAPEAEIPLSIGRILHRTAYLLRRSAARAGIALVLLAAPGVVIDAGLVGADGELNLTLLNSVLSLAMHFWLTRALLQELGWDLRSGVAFPAYFGLALISNIGIAVGLILFVVPGVVLFVRWSMSVPMVLSSDDGVIDSMRRSWRETEGRFWPILGAFMVIYLPALVLAAVGFLLQGQIPNPLAGAILANLALQAAIIAGWHAAVAIYALLSSPAALSRVFE